MFRFIALIFVLVLAACAPTPQPAALIVNTPTPSLTPTPPHSPTPSLPAPRLINRQPSYSHIEDRQPVITLKFDRAMAAESVARALTVDPVMPISVTAYGGVTVTINTLAPLTPSGTYTFTLGAIATDAHGLALDQEYQWAYTLKPVLSRVTGPVRYTIKIYFNYPMHPESVARALWLTPALSGTLGWDADQTVATFTPTVPFASDTLYLLHFDRAPLFDEAGDRLPTPAPLSFVTPPPISAHAPAPSANASPANTVRVTFTRPMRHASVEAAFSITPTIAGTFSWKEETLIFTPHEGYLNESTDYTVSLAPTVQALDTEAPVLHTAYTWSFRTAPLEPVASFGYGPNAQVLSATGRRAVQFAVYQPRFPGVSLELYRLDPSQWLERYASGFTADWWDETPPFNTDDLTRVAQWSVALTQVVKNDYANYVYETQLPADAPPGVYVLNLSAGRVNDQLLIVLTQHTLVVKYTPDEIVAWVTDFSGAPVAEAVVNAYASSGGSIGQCRTDAQGLCRLTLDPLNSPMLVMAEKDGDLTVAGLSGAWQRTYGQTPRRYAVHLYTDQPTYRPGQTVYFNAFMREDQDATLSVPPSGTVVTARLRDAMWNDLRTFFLTTDEFGAVHSLFRLAPDAAPGPYTIELIAEGETHTASFIVQAGEVESRYVITLTTDAAAYILGDAIQLTGQVTDDAGQPAPNVRVTLTQYEAGSSYGCGYGSCGVMWNDSYRPALSGLTDANGEVTLTALAQTGYSGGRWGFALRAGGQGRAFTTVDVFNVGASLQLTLPGGNIAAPGQPFEVSLGARTIWDEPFGNAPLQLSLRQWDTALNDYARIAQSFDLMTDAEGRATLPLTVAEPGHYRLHFAGEDQRGRVIETQHDLIVFAEGAALDNGGVSDIRLIADRAHYAPGESASLLIESAFSGPALLTVERGTVRRAEWLMLTAPVTRFTLPIQANDAPNVHVTVHAWQPTTTVFNEYAYDSLPEARLRTASLSLNVPVTGKDLTITITSHQAEYAAGETATFTVRVTDAAGAPVAAQLSLALVDENVFALNAGLADSIFGAFYFGRGARPSAYTALEPRRALFEYGGCGGCGGDGGGIVFPGQAITEAALWEPALHTDANGEVTLTVTLPNTPTHWRLTAVAVTAETQVGAAMINVVSR